VQYPTDDITDPRLAANAQLLASGLRSAEEQALERLGNNQIRVAMQALPEQFRTAVYYADVEGFRASALEAAGPCRHARDRGQATRRYVARFSVPSAS